MTTAASADVLVVDDDLMLLRSMDRALRALGYETFATTDSMSALDVLRTRRFSLLVLDVQMPRMSGIELAERVRNGEAGSLNRDVPIVFVTADDSAATYQATFDVSAIRYLAKPVHAHALEHEIDNILHV
jgi:CheY-like chemotaxis protein